MAAVDLARSFFLAGTVAGGLLHHMPILSKSVLSYGARAQPPNDTTSQVERPTSGKPDKAPLVWSNRLLSLVQSGVPHSWFVHYYILSVTLSLFWGYQLLAKGRVFLLVSQYVHDPAAASSMTSHQTMLVWLLMLAQGVRRLLETIAFTKPSASRMPWSIWALGIAYYAFMSVAVWIEGTHAVLASPASELALPTWPSVRTTVSLMVFTFGYGIQHDCHAYLASLPKYTLPVHPAFQSIVSPHYTAELVLYLALAFIAAPKGQWVNRTLMCNVVWVMVNLGVVADETKRWSENKFGRDKVRHRARMIPGIW